MTAETDLLPIPNPVGSWDSEWQEYGYTSAQMQAYARANVEHHTAAKDAEIEALRAEVERLTNFNADTCEGFNRLSVERTALITRAERLAEALRRVVKSFPDESVLLDAGWDGAEVDEACEAYDAARAALEQENDDA